MDQNIDNLNYTPEDPPSQPGSTTPEQPTVSEPPATGNSGEITKDAKMWGMFCHLAGLAMYLSIPLANILGPLIIWLIKKDDFEFVNDQGKEALNFQISVTIYLVACIPLFFVFIGFFLLPVVAIFNLVMIIIASISANKGESYRYPLCIRLVK